MSEDNGSEKSKIIKTQDENGVIHNFELIDVLEVDDQEYGLLIYIDEENPPEDDEEEEVIVMRLSQGDDGYTFELIEDDEEFERVTSEMEIEYEMEEDEEEE